ncbi:MULTISPECIES: group II intron reverse transcriptase/maturase [Paenibacillus]|uniref:RNA-directed DNA polymerase n=1 Tax=Paenibacillus odorifer TaxID=189426 RepID=A0A1R0X013_9BACL|nr:MULTISPECIES: group II intron reverse transcriptase/maturase [Paenibacillus]MEC0135268.1 group II intron reverse transcriptase/maturase [Paenibacillus odorifer]MEC0224126.1 group II intron reverse transcriptase/maturase [Paenibacillus odorifer]OMD25340.1 group II intron reverse transcriptase/maturase [Paenibacillus odorifer]OME24815.1 group II intron reverse transcriptase/maturase [Paenibacillus odorifer]OME32024.1 group II intron reverse transcriptase/maturase [Paenibacillus odorifer]
MLEQLLSRENLLQALKRVEANKGSHGVDGMSVKSLREHIVQNWQTLRHAIEEGTYEPSPVRRVEIPKPGGGGVRLLGIPTVTDRMIQQAIAQVLTPLFDPEFSDHSYGFRPKRRGHDAVRKARTFMKEGYRFVVDLDLEKFFDRVNHDRLMMKISEKVEDKKVLLLIRKYLQSGVMENGLVTPTTEGAPQGGPLSPLLSNIVLDELDKELEKRGHRFVRYADDCNIYVKTLRAGERVKTTVTRFIETRLKLKVNQVKSAVDRPWKRKFLGFSFSVDKEPKVRIAKQSLQRVKVRIQEISSRKRSMKMEERIKELNHYLMGWCGYFSLADTPSTFRDMDKWIRRRLRMCLWKQWKTPRTKVKRLISLGVPKDKAYEWGNTRKGYWRIAGSPILQHALNNQYWEANGLKSVLDRYNSLRNIS